MIQPCDVSMLNQLVSLPCFPIERIPWLHHCHILCCFLLLQTQTFYPPPYIFPTFLILLSPAFSPTWTTMKTSLSPDTETESILSSHSSPQPPVVCPFFLNPWFELLPFLNSSRHFYFFSVAQGKTPCASFLISDAQLFTVFSFIKGGVHIFW